MNLIFLGDIVGKGGRQAVVKVIPELRREFNAQFIIANAENSAAGSGITAKCLQEMQDAVDVFTGGDHTWDQRGFDCDVPRLEKFVRPANFAACQPGKGCRVFRNAAGGEIAVISLVGKVFMRDSAYDPFEQVEKELAALPAQVKTVFVDFHAEATSEKIAMGYFLDSRVTAVVGTHTHVQTGDARVLPGGTACLTDAGMCGAATSVLGRAVPDVLRKFTTGMPARLEVVETGVMQVCGCVVSYDAATGKASSLTPFARLVEV